MRNVRGQNWQRRYNERASVTVEMGRRRRRRYGEERREKRWWWRRRRRWRRWKRRRRWGQKRRSRTTPLGKVTSAMMITVMTMMMCMSMAMFMRAQASAIPVKPIRVLHYDIVIILVCSREEGVWNLAGSFVIIYSEAKETAWPLATTEGSNMLFILFL
jgi:hypothetical protein